MPEPAALLPRARRLVRVYEVGPCAGPSMHGWAQGWAQERPMAPASVVQLVDRLAAAGLRQIEAACFVSCPEHGSAVLAGLARRPGVAYAAAVGDLLGYGRARAGGAGEIAVRIAAGGEAGRRLARLEPICAAALDDGLPVRATLMGALAPAVRPAEIAALSARLVAMGCREVSLDDGGGAASPATAAALLRAVLEEVPASQLACRFAQARGDALPCVEAALDLGLAVFDAAAGGGADAAGPLATGTLAGFLETRGYRTGIDRAALAVAEAPVGDRLRQPA